ncbi:transposase [Paracoccus sp. JM45]|nr:transposase [Paracoccus sp. JM45]
MEACATAHGSGREFEKSGHDVRLIPPVYVEWFVKSQKNDVADAEAIAEDPVRVSDLLLWLPSLMQEASDPLRM